MKDVSDWFAKAIVTLAETWNHKLSEVKIRLYAEALADIPPEMLRLAFAQAVRESKFFPSPAEIRGYVMGTADEAALLAWSGFLKAANKVGGYDSLDVDDPRAAAAFLHVFSSWSDYCALEGPAVGARRSEFLAAYKAAGRTTLLASPHRLAGASTHNTKLPVARLTAAGEIADGAPALAAGPDVSRITDGGPRG